MSNRYVWGRFNIEYSSSAQSLPPDRETSTDDSWSPSSFGIPGSPASLYMKVGQTFSQSGGKFLLSGNVFDLTITANSNSVLSQFSDNGYVKYSDSAHRYVIEFYAGISAIPIYDSTQFDAVYKFTVGPSDSTATFQSFAIYLNTGVVCFYARSSGWMDKTCSTACERNYGIGSKGTANGTVSNSASSTYPPNDMQPRIASTALLRRCKYGE